MNEFLINNYINSITLNHIINFAKNEGIILKSEEAEIIEIYIKKYWKIFYHGDPSELFEELKEKLEKNTYDKMIELYYEYKKKIK